MKDITYAGVTSTTEPTTLTMEGLRAVIDLIKPVLYYVVDGRVVEKGFILRVEEGLCNPLFIVLHPENEEEYLDALSKQYRCVSVRDEPVEERTRRFMKYNEGVFSEWLT